MRLRDADHARPFKGSSRMANAEQVIECCRGANPLLMEGPNVHGGRGTTTTTTTNNASIYIWIILGLPGLRGHN